MTRQEAIEKMCWETSIREFQTGEYGEKGDAEGFRRILTEEGRFPDLADDPEGAIEAVYRLVVIAGEYHWKKEKEWPKGLQSKVLKGITHYCKIEADREDRGYSRFHASIFRFPQLALKLYFIMYPEMEKLEKGAECPKLLAKAHEQILRVAYQTFTLPDRGDETDKDPVSVERFRNHVWWVGGNAFRYRPVFKTALAFKSEKMLQVLSEAAARSISATSLAVCRETFWSEGLCADGFGWGHGRQTYNTGYPADGLTASLTILSYIVGTPFEEWINCADFSRVVNFIRGITWGEYRGFTAPMQTRTIFEKVPKSRPSVESLAVNLAEFLKKYFWKYLSEGEKKEMDELLEKRNFLDMDAPKGNYQGVRYFWNNDDLIKKEDGFYFYVNMASSRCDGVEFADCMADKRNYYTADGSYTLLTDGEELREVMGTWQMAHLPGVTERWLPNCELLTETNWHGYRSRHNFAAGAAGGADGVCGFIYEKDDTREPDGAGVTAENFSREMCGIQAYKAYFVTGGVITCLGAGITDLQPEYGREVHTTVNNTRWSGGAKLHETADSFLIENDHILYRIKKDSKTEVKLAAEKRMTNWLDLNLLNKDVADEEVPVFELVLNHGVNPVNAGYEYTMCVKGAEEDILVLENSTSLQAVASADYRVVEGVFYETAAALQIADMEIRVSEPCAVLLQREEGGYRIAVCDAEQNPALCELTVTVCRGEERENLVIEMPKGLYRGKQGEGFLPF